jgi:hypothetical protein
VNASILSVFEACAAATGKPFRRPMRGTQTKCPLHDDGTASLSINDAKGTFNCFAGCARGGILDAPIAFGIAKDRKESSKWLAQRGLIPQAQSTGFRTITAPNRIYTDATALSAGDRVWRHFAIQDLRAFIGEVRLRTVRDHIAELRYERDRKEGDGMALLRCMAVYEASKHASEPSSVVRLARDTFPQFFAGDPLA